MAASSLSMFNSCENIIRHRGLHPLLAHQPKYLCTVVNGMATQLERDVLELYFQLLTIVWPREENKTLQRAVFRTFKQTHPTVHAFLPRRFELLQRKYRPEPGQRCIVHGPGDAVHPFVLRRDEVADQANGFLRLRHLVNGHRQFAIRPVVETKEMQQVIFHVAKLPVRR